MMLFVALLGFGGQYNPLDWIGVAAPYLGLVLALFPVKAIRDQRKHILLASVSIYVLFLIMAVFRGSSGLAVVAFFFAIPAVICALVYGVTLYIRPSISKNSLGWLCFSLGMVGDFILVFPWQIFRNPPAAITTASFYWVLSPIGFCIHGPFTLSIFIGATLLYFSFKESSDLSSD